MRRFILGLLWVATTVVCVHGARSADRAPEGPLRASFDRGGNAKLPVAYRQWMHIGTRYKPDGTNIFDGLPLKAPELMNAYVEPRAFTIYQATGRWPDGTQIVKELAAIQVGDGCDEVTRVCTKALGRGIFEAHYNGLGLMVKDAKRFPDAAGNWGYFQFGHKPPPYNAISPLLPRAQCESCHVNLASDTDYVISQAHLGLAR